MADLEPPPAGSSDQEVIEYWKTMAHEKAAELEALQ
eukprot:SAG11_NODE_14828_length_598_cov_1.124248_1_plen_35_part_10